MNRLFVKHPIVAGYVFCVLILYWLALGNLSPLVVSQFNIAISLKTLLYALIISMIASNIILYRYIPSKKMSTYELFLNSLLPVLVYYMLKMIDYNGVLVLITVGLIFIGSVCIYCLQKYCKLKRIRMVYFVRHIIAFNIILLIIPGYLYYRYEKPMEEYIGRVDETSLAIVSQENELEKLREKIHSCDWNNMTIDEKGALMLEFVETESKDLGIEPPILNNKNLDSGSYKGLYNHGSQTITMNSYFLIAESKEDCFNTVAHELYHSFQHSVIDIMREIDTEEYEYNSYFKKGKNWILAQSSYDEDCKTAQGYQNNALEVDAREFAEKLIARKYGFKDDKNK